MANEIRDAFNVVYADGPAGNPAQPQKPRIRTEIGGVIQSQVDALQQLVDDVITPLAFATWTALNAVQGRTDGQLATVAVTDTGTHTDPVVGGTVDNSGRYGWHDTMPKGWQRLGDLLEDPGDIMAELDNRLRAVNMLDDAIIKFVHPATGRTSLLQDRAGILRASGGYGSGLGGWDLIDVSTVGNDSLVLAGANGAALMRVDERGLHLGGPAAGSRATIAERLDAYLTGYGMPRHRFGQERLRETNQRFWARRLGESRRCGIALVGDSYTWNYARWSRRFASYLTSQFGDGGGGYLSFAQISGTGNGNLRADYTVSLSGSWDTSVYTAAASADLGQITSSTPGDKVTITAPASPVTTAMVLHFKGTANGVVRYRYNGGSWTSLNVQGVVGASQTVSLSTGLPGSGSITLEVEVVSGTVTLFGSDAQASASGVVVHKLGASGSQLRQWALADAAQWQTAFGALNADLVIVMLATNDEGQSRDPALFGADMETLLGRCRAARPTCDLLVAAPPENQRPNVVPYFMSEYTAASALAAARCDAAFVDIQQRFGRYPSDYADGSARPWMVSDGIHPDTTFGGVALCGAVLDAILYP